MAAGGKGRAGKKAPAKGALSTRRPLRKAPASKKLAATKPALKKAVGKKPPKSTPRAVPRKVAPAKSKSQGKKTSTARVPGAKGAKRLDDKAGALDLYRDMLLIRRFEERAGQMYGMGLIGGFCHLYIGQEAVVVGLQSRLNEADSVITSYRDHGHMLVCGMDPKGVMAELTGRRSGYSKGKGGSMHMFSAEKRFYGGHGIVAAQVPIGTGLAFAHKYRGDGGVCVTYFGEGAANQGQVYEAFNMAALWSLPVLYVIENNKYGMGTPVERAAAVTEMYKHGAALGIPGTQVDGMDVLAVRAAAGRALDYVRGGKGPYLLEMMTYRYRGHSMSDPAKYRAREEVSQMRAEHDPIDHLGALLIEGGAADEAALKEVDAKIRAVVADAAEFAQQSPEPDPAELYTDILAEA